jgi:hypothetical protein
MKELENEMKKKILICISNACAHSLRTQKKSLSTQTFFSTKARRTHLQFCLREKESLEPKNRYPWSGAMSLSLLRGTSVGENSGVGWGKRLLFAWVQGSAH